MVRRLRSPFVWIPISVVLLAIVVWRSSIWEAGSAIRDPDGSPILFATLLSALLPALWAIRSARLLAPGHLVPVTALIPMTTLANTINNLTPGSVGELLRLYLLRAHHSVPYVTGGAVILVERLGALGYLTLSGIVAWLGVVAGWPAWWVLAGFLLVAVTPLVLYRLGLRPLHLFVARPLGSVVGRRFALIATSLSRTEEEMAELLGDPLGLATFALTSALIFATNAAQLTLVALAIGVDISPLAAWGALGLSITVGVLSLLPFGLGAADLTLVALLGILGVAPTDAAAIALGYRLVATLPVALAGVAAYAWLSARLPAHGVTGAAAMASAGLIKAEANPSSPDRPA